MLLNQVKRVAALLAVPGAFFVTAAVTLMSASPAQAQLNFNFTPETGQTVSAQAQQGFQDGADFWRGFLNDNITVNLTIGFRSLSPGVIAQAGSTLLQTTYADVSDSLRSDLRSADDQTATGSLPGGSGVNFLINRTSANGNSATPYLDNNNSANNTNIVSTKANFKALGAQNLDQMFGTNDATIIFNSDFAFDFDRSNGIDSNAFDFVGVAAHEIGHSLGFISGVDDLDASPGASEDSYRLFIMDLFRYSNDSVAQGVRDFTADNRDKFFSINGGASQISLFSTGPRFGDGRQASHWKDNELTGTYYGIMDPTGRTGELLNLTENDRRMLDVIGYNRFDIGVVPEPGTLALVAVGAIGPGGLALIRRRRRKK